MAHEIFTDTESNDLMTDLEAMELIEAFEAEESELEMWDLEDVFYNEVA